MLKKVLNEDLDLQENKRKGSKFKNRYVKKDQLVRTRKRGFSRYFLFVQERLFDIYCFLSYSSSIPPMEDNFKTENLLYCHKDIENVKDFLISLRKEKGKRLAFSLHSLKLDL